MKHFFITALACAATLFACACNSNKPTPEPEPEPEPEPSFTLDSYNGRFVEALAGAYDTFEKEGSLPPTVNVEGIKYTKGQYTIAACMLIGKIAANAETWQDEDIDVFAPAFSGFPVSFCDSVTIVSSAVSMSLAAANLIWRTNTSSKTGVAMSIALAISSIRLMFSCVSVTRIAFVRSNT